MSVLVNLYTFILAYMLFYTLWQESDLESLCHSCGLETCTDESGNKSLPTKQSTFSHPKGGFQKYSFLGLQEYERQF